MPTSVVEREIDTYALENEHTLFLAGDHLPERYRKKELFSRFNLPQVNHITSLTISAPTLKGKVQNGVIAAFSHDDKGIIGKIKTFVIKTN